jgi:hypothetical protein
MTLIASEPTHISVVAEQDLLLAEFFAAVRQSAKEIESAVALAKPALGRIAAAISQRDHGQALRLRSLLFSLYSGGSALADLSDIMTLDWSLRKDFCTVVLAFGHGDFGHASLKAAFEQVGDVDATWFLADVPDPRARLREALRFAHAGSVLEPRSRGERAVCQLLLSLFSDATVNLHSTLQGLDAERAKLMLSLLSDFIAWRFDFTDADHVQAHFSGSKNI